MAMRLPGFTILKEVTKRREMSLGQVCELVPRRFGDYRDFYALASLYTGRLIDTSFKREGCNWDINKNNLVAEEIFTMSLGKGTFNIQGMPEFTNEEDYRQTFKVFCTANADLFFEERRQKRIERISGLAIGIIVGIVSALAGTYLRGAVHF